MRVIAGVAKGRKLQTVEGLSTRPTTDRIKETLFNMIAFDLPQCKFLDLFSGSGAIGIEALSRGAEHAVFVENNLECQRMIEQNLIHTKLDKQARIVGLEMQKALLQLSNEKAVFDIIFLDPPYETEMIQPTLLEIVHSGLLSKDGYVIAEHAAKIPLPSVSGLRILREKEYRTTVLTFLCLEEENI